MTDWFAEIGRPRRGVRAAVWLAAIGISVAVNWSGAWRLDAEFDRLARKPPDRPAEEPSVEVWVEPFEERFVEANPEVPTNRPDDTRNIAARDQQAAEEEPDPADDSSFPRRDTERESQTFVERGETSEPLPPGVYSESASREPPRDAGGGTVGEMAPRAERETPDWVESEEEGPGDRIPAAEDGEEKTDEAERRPGTLRLDDGPEREPEESATANNPAARPLPRKKVGADALLAPLNRSEERAPRRGRLGVDSRLTDFGDYTQRALEAIQAEWHRLIREVSLGSSSAFSSVTVEFYLDQAGSVDEARVVETTSGELGTMICLDAIYARAPYGRWTGEMKRILGERTRIEITFHYR
jgi:hypothetical protein